MRSTPTKRQDQGSAGKTPGLSARQLAVRLVAGVLVDNKPLDQLLEALLGATEFAGLEAILLTAAAQLLCLDMPAHAVVDLAVEMARRDRSARRYVKLVNAVLRR